MVASYPWIIDKAKCHISSYGWDNHYGSFLSLENFRCANCNVIEIMLTAHICQKFTLQSIWCNNTNVRLFDWFLAVFIAGCEQFFYVINDHIHFTTIVKTVKAFMVKRERELKTNKKNQRKKSSSLFFIYLKSACDLLHEPWTFFKMIGKFSAGNNFDWRNQSMQSMGAATSNLLS